MQGWRSPRRENQGWLLREGTTWTGAWRLRRRHIVLRFFLLSCVFDLSPLAWDNDRLPDCSRDWRRQALSGQHGSPAGVESGEDRTLPPPRAWGLCGDCLLPVLLLSELKGQAHLVNRSKCSRVVIRCLWLIPPPPSFSNSQGRLGLEFWPFSTGFQIC